MTDDRVSFVDEAARVDPGVYVTVAVTIPDAAARLTSVRDAAGTLAPRPGARFHWRDQEHPGRLAAVDLIVGLPAVSVVVVGTGLHRRKQERARRQCLATLLWRLDQDGVRQVWLESRDEPGNSRDIAAVRAFRAQHVIGHGIRVDHRGAATEEALWLADAVAGAVSLAEAGDPTYRDRLAGVLTEHRITLT